jgi:hypothetical protein
VFDYWLARRQRRIEIAAVQWTATLFALPGILLAVYEWPVTMNTVGGFELFWHGAAAGAGLGAGLAFALRGFWNDVMAEWFGFVLCLLLAGGAVATHVNAEQPEASRTLVASLVVDDPESPGRFTERALRQRCRARSVGWQVARCGRVDRDRSPRGQPGRLRP